MATFLPIHCQLATDPNLSAPERRLSRRALVSTKVRLPFLPGSPLPIRGRKFHLRPRMGRGAGGEGHGAEVQ